MLKVYINVKNNCTYSKLFKKNYSLSKNVRSWYNQEIIDFRFTSSGRYGFLVRERPLESLHRQPTHFYELLFTVIDTFSGNLSNYKILTCLFKVVV